MEGRVGAQEGVEIPELVQVQRGVATQEGVDRVVVVEPLQRRGGGAQSLRSSSWMVWKPRVTVFGM